MLHTHKHSYRMSKKSSYSMTKNSYDTQRDTRCLRNICVLSYIIHMSHTHKNTDTVCPRNPPISQNIHIHTNTNILI